MALGHLHATFRHAAIYASGIVLARLVAFLMIPVYTRVLTPADYGVLEILSLSIDLVATLAGLGLSQAVTRYYYHYDDPASRNEVVGSAIVTFGGTFVLLAALLMPFADELSSLLLGDVQHSSLIRLALLGFLANSLLEIPGVYLRAKQASGQAVLLYLARLVLALTLNLVLVVTLGLGVAGVLYSTIVTSTLVGAGLLVLTLRETGLHFRFSHARDLVAYGAPLVAWAVGSFVLHHSDRYFLRAYDSLASIGLYSLAYKLAMVLPFFVSAPFGQIWAAKSLEIERQDSGTARSAFREILAYYNVAVVGGGMGLALFGGELIRLVADPSFHAAAEPVPVLCLGMVFFCYRQVSQVGATIRYRTGLIGLSTGLAAVAVTAFNVLLIPRWGIMGAAAATALAFAIEYVVMNSLSSRVYPPVYPPSELLRPLFLAALLVAPLLLLVPSTAPPALTLGLKLAAFAGFFGLLPAVGAVPTSRYRALLRLLRDPRSIPGRLWNGSGPAGSSAPLTPRPGARHEA